MKQSKLNDGRASRPSFFTAALTELMVIGGASLASIFIIIPSQTSPSDEIGLAPGFVPTVCAAAIGLLAVAQFAVSIVGQHRDEDAPRIPIGHALALMGATIVAALVTWFIGLLAGCSLLALLVSLVLGERRILRLALITGGVGLTIFVVEWMGF